MLLSEGQMSDYKGAASMVVAPPPAKQLLGDKGYHADWFRQALAVRGITACIPIEVQPRKADRHTAFSIANGTRSKIRSAGSRGLARRIDTRYDRCAHNFMSAICIAAAVIFWL